MTFPDRFEFRRESEGEVRYIDPVTGTRIVFVVSRLPSGDTFEDAVDRMVRRLSRNGNLGALEYVSDTHAEGTLIELFRLVSELSIFLGEDCWGKPLLVRTMYTYDRTRAPEAYWLSHDDPGYPQFEFAYRCPS